MRNGPTATITREGTHPSLLDGQAMPCLVKQRAPMPGGRKPNPWAMSLPPGRGETEETEGNLSFSSGALGEWNGRKEPDAVILTPRANLPVVSGNSFLVDL